MTPDQINAAFEFFGALLIGLSIWRLHVDKMVRGVSPVPVTFFATWGFWNLAFYPALEQWWSFTAGLLMVFMNSIWLVQMCWYVAREKLCRFRS
ncbi:MAG: hypothetical protein ACXVCO_10080 [Ktedonobacterales bacterium]